MTRKNTILIFGGTTHQNRGDLAMHAGFLQWLRNARPDLEPLFLANNPEHTAEVLGVTSIRSPDAALAQPWNKETRMSTRQRIRSYARGFRFVLRPEGLREHFQRAVAAFIPGSGSMNSLWWHDWLHVKAWEALAARRAGIPVFATSQGVGPEFTHPLDARAARMMFNACEVVGVRDGEASAGILRSCGVNAGKIAHTGDDALLLRPDQEGGNRLLGGFGAGHPLVALNLRDASSYGKKYPKPDFEFWSNLLRDLAALPSSPHFLFLPVSYDPMDDDRRPARSLIDSLVATGIPSSRFFAVEESVDARVLLALAARAAVGVGISYHFLLFCLHAGVPAFGLWQNPYYKAKIEGLMALYQCPQHAHALAEISPAMLSLRVREALADRAAHVYHLEAVSRHLQSVAEQTRARILECFPPPP
ncbi:MAG: polysaccharide pyruvyl transferase family protein [Verrucomicrobiales bacterium]